MKKTILITALISSLLQAEVIYKNKNNDTSYKSDKISFSNSEVYRVSNYRDYVEVTISTKEHGRIRTKLDRTSLKEGDKVIGNCSNYEYGEYKKCYISRY
ncbi:hypothetical protein [Arcobacter aquimarinus]|uniref:hypothetical protein n=1 Tax=Arcobacter aquimarinus TaxID=1315211 RepID=UPI003BAFC6E0